MVLKQLKNGDTTYEKCYSIAFRELLSQILLSLFSCSVASNSLWSHGLQHARPLYPLPSPRAYSNSCPLSQWCHPTISSSVIPLLLLPSIFPSIRVFSNELALCIRWPNYWSFSLSISPSKAIAYAWPYIIAIMQSQFPTELWSLSLTR